MLQGAQAVPNLGAQNLLIYNPTVTTSGISTSPTYTLANAGGQAISYTASSLVNQ